MRSDKAQFRLEREMLEPTKKWFEQSGLILKTEFEMPWGICDLVGVSFNLNRVKQRLRLRQAKPIGPVHRVALLSSIPDAASHRSIELGALRSVLHESFDDAELEHEVARLLKAKHVRLTRSGRIQKLNGWAPLHRRIVAVELKLNRIDDAFNQALSHLSFATESYVGLPMSVAFRILRQERVQSYQRAGVGIIAIEKNRCRVVVRSRPSVAVDEILQAHCIERFWRSWVRGNSA